MNLATLLDHGQHNARALATAERSWTYGELRAAVSAFGESLSLHDLARGDRVGLIAGNSAAFVVTSFAALAAGLVVVPLNPVSPHAELRRELHLTGARVVFVDPSVSDQPTAGDLGVDAVVAVHVGSPPASDAPIEAVDCDADALAFLLFTSGTAGPPAAAMLSHGNLMANLAQVAAHPGAALTPDDVVLVVAPLCHVFGLNAILHPALDAGACAVLVEHFNAAATLAVIDALDVTIVSGPPALWEALAGACDDPGVFQKVRLALSGAAPLDGRTVAAVQARCGVSLQQGYGLTEASPVVALAVGTDAPASSVGIPVPGLEVRLVDAIGEDVYIGDEGEVWVRGPNVFAGYWRDDAATARALTRDGWLRTGDVAVVDESGRLTLVDRLKELIIVSGFNVHPAEVEAVLLEVPEVQTAAVRGVAHPGTGERVEASVVLAPGARTTAAELIEHCRTQLARYKVPAAIHLVESVPRGVTGKVLRRKMEPPADS